VATTKDETAGEAATGTGALIGAGLGILAGLAAVTVPGVGVVAAAGPIIAGGVVGAVAGGLVGSLVDAGVPAEEAENYAEAVRRGGTLLTVRCAPADADRIVIILNRHNPVDIRQRSQSWREQQALQSSWTESPDVSGRTTLGDAAAHMPEPQTRQADATGGSVVPASASTGAPNGEDQLAVGRDVAVRADQAPLPQHPPVGRVEPIPVTTSPSVQPDTDYKDFEPDFRKDFEASFPGAEYSYDRAKPAYQYGCELARAHRGDDWEKVEPEARRRWKQRHPAATWDRIKSAARYAYDRVRQKA